MWVHRHHALLGLRLLLLLLAMLHPASAEAGKRSMIPPGQEQTIREFVDVALADAQAADELPVAVDERSSIVIDRDRVRVILHPLEPGAEPLPRVVVFHPEAIASDFDEALAPAVMIECGTLEAPGPCSKEAMAAWRPVARRLAAARAPVAERIWRLEETGVQAYDEVEVERAGAELWLDRGAAILAVLLGLGLASFASSRRSPSERVSKGELAALLALLILLVGATASFTNLLPLHEHNSFIARSDCAVARRCVEDPAAAWSMTTLHAYGLLLELIPYRAGALAWLSLSISVIMLVLVWALTRRLAIELGQGQRASAAGIGAVAVLASNPVVWRLSGAASFWPWTLSWTLVAALAGLWAARACVSEDRGERLAGAAAWVLAAVGLALAAAGNLVCLTLGAVLLLAPVCWSRAGAESSWSAALGRAAWIGPPALVGFALLVGPDYERGYTRAFGPTGLQGSATVEGLVADFKPLLLDPAIVTPVWALATLAAFLLWLWQRLWQRLRQGQRQGRRPSPSEPGSRGRALRLLAPLLYAYGVPAAFLGRASGEVIGSGYPSGFLNHHWELVFTAIAVGLGLAWLIGSLEQLRPALARLRWTLAVPATLTAGALLLAPFAREGWRMATGELVLERELVALERSFASLPEHDLLVVAPRTLAPLTNLPSRWDPLEVVFPVGFYEHALRERGLEPALVVSLDRLPPPRPGERTLLYVGSSLRSFQPHEIEDHAVPDALERPELTRLRDAWALEPVYEFTIATAQHEAISLRLGADRVAELELGFAWMTPHE